MRGILVSFLLALSLGAPILSRALSAEAADDAPALQLDPVFQTNGLPDFKIKDFVARFKDLAAPRVSVTPQTAGFNDVPRLNGRTVTLFGVNVDSAGFVFDHERLGFINIAFLNRGRAASITQQDFEKLVQQCIDAISVKTGVVPVKLPPPARAGSLAYQRCSWPGSAFSLIYRYWPSDASRSIPFRADSILLQMGGLKPNSK
jgi:hypothetical protein